MPAYGNAGLGFKDGRNEDGISDGKDSDGLIPDAVQLVG